MKVVFKIIELLIFDWSFGDTESLIAKVFNNLAQLKREVHIILHLNHSNFTSSWKDDLKYYVREIGDKINVL